MSRSRHRSAAFTLVELLASIAILGLLTFCLFSVINSSTNIASTTTVRLDTNRVARECLDLIGHDLGALPLPYNRSANSLQLEVNPPSLPAKFKHPGSIFWQARAARSRQFGDLTVIGYFVLQDIQPGKNRFQLRKLAVDPTDPAGASTDYLIYSNPNDWHPASLLAAFAPDSATEDNDAGQKGWVADGVLGMWIRALDPLGNPITTDASGTPFGAYEYDSRKSYVYTDAAGVLSYPTGKKVGTGAVAAALPAIIEVGLVCVAPQEIAKITSLPVPTATDPAAFYNDISAFVSAAAAQNPRTKSIQSFTRRYRLYSGR